MELKGVPKRFHGNVFDDGRRVTLADEDLRTVPVWLSRLTALAVLDLHGNQLTALPDWLGNLPALSQLDLGENQLTVVPDALGNLSALTQLDLSENLLTVLPDALGNLSALTQLDLGGNQLTVLPDALGNLPALTHLTLWRNQLTSVPDGLSNLTALTHLDLAENQLATLPDAIGSLTALTQLDLWGNELTSLPYAIGNLTALTQLDLWGNELRSVPNWLDNLTALTELDLYGNQLTALSDSFANLTNLTQLNLGRNQLTKLHNALANLTGLTQLNLSGNQLTGLPDWLGGLTSLTQLDLSGNQLTGLPDWLGGLTSLTQLDLNGNQLTGLPDALSNLTGLTQLDLSGNQLTTLPDWLGGLTRLTQLKLSGNRLTAVPLWLGDLTGLTQLKLSGNQLTALSDALSNLTALTRLDVAENQLTAVPDWLGDLTSLIRLNLSGNRLTGLPDALSNLTGLTQLDLSGNHLTGLPDALGNLTALTWLDLGGNQLTGLPAWLCNLTALSQLVLYANELTSVPAWIGDLTALNELNLGGNQLTALPDSLGNLIALARLYLWGNKLTSFPDCMRNLTNLLGITLGGNQLTSVPDWIGNLTILGELDLNNNQLTTLPISLADLLTNGTNLDLRGNPLPEPLLELAAYGPVELATYLRSLEEAVPQYEAKMLLVGEGNVGKSSLVAALKGAPFVEGRSTTHGIEISPMTFRHPTLDIDMTLRVWDFGGQEVYRVSHQFFFSPRALYLVVWHARQGQEHDEVENWLRRIRLRVGSGARAIVIATHCAERAAEFDYPHLEKLFPGMVIGAFEIDSCTGLGLEGLRKAIADLAAKLPQMGQLISPRWMAAREAVMSRAKTEPQIRYEQFVKICEEYGLAGPEISTLAKLMHDLGLIIYYAEDDGLKDIVVLNPEWLTKAISYVLNDGFTKQDGGVLDHSRLREIWNDRNGEYDPRYHRYFLRLMEKFDISYRIDGDELHSLVAQLVPHQRPVLPWELGQQPPAGVRSLSLICRLSDTVPGLIPWLTVRHHRASTGTHWRRGIYLCHPIAAYASEALLELRGGNELIVEVRAPSPDLYLNVLRDSIEDLIARRWPGLTYRLYIPCTGRTAVGSPCPGQFPLDGLLRQREGGQTVVACMDCPEVHEIAALLTGFAAPVQPLAAELQLMRDQLANITTNIAGFRGQAADMADAIRRVHRVVSTEVVDCPRLFTLAKIRPSGSRRVRIHENHYRLTLWCENPGYEHPCEAATYELDPPKEWFMQIAPYAVLVFRTLQLIVPLTGAVAVASQPQTKRDDAQAHLQIMSALVSDLPTSAGLEVLEEDIEETAGRLTPAQGQALRALRAIIFEHDKLRAFGGLRRVQAPSGDLLWVCKDHYSEYDPGLPVVP